MNEVKYQLDYQDKLAQLQADNLKLLAVLGDTLDKIIDNHDRTAKLLDGVVKDLVEELAYWESAIVE